MSLRVSARLNDQGALVSSDLYDAYGQLRAGNPNNDPVGYCGQWGYYTDHSTGYILCTYRWYDPTTARWLTRDPIEYEGGLNLYGYVGGNPVGWADPLGLWGIQFGNQRNLGIGNPTLHFTGEDLRSTMRRPIGLLTVAASATGAFVAGVSNGCDPDAPRRLQDIVVKIANIRRSIEDGLSDTGWANGRLRELLDDRLAIPSAAEAVGEPPQIDWQTAMGYRKDALRLVAHGTNAEKKRLLAAWVDKIELAPETLEVEIRFKVPEPVVDKVRAGVGFEPTTFGL